MATSSINPDKRLDRHGGPWDRGSADKYYGRPARPHYYLGATGSTERVPKSKMTETEIQEYMTGYQQEEDRKDWG